MKQIFFFFLFPIILCVSCSSSQTFDDAIFAKYGIFDTDGIKPEEYHQRRAKVMAKMDSGSIAILRANDPCNRNGDTDYKFRQNDNFLYLTGCNETNSTLILVPDGVLIDSITIAKEILFVQDSPKRWTGKNLGVEGAKEILGFGAEGTASIALAGNKLKDILSKALESNTILYYSPLSTAIFDPVSDMNFIITDEIKKVLEEKYPNHTMRSSDLLVHDLRAVKSPTELVLMQKAIDATAAGYIETMKSCEQGMYEYELQAVIEYCFTRSGCEYYGFPSIIGSGRNALFFHYDANRRQMKNGDLVVMDIGAEYHGYTADVTRTIPVNGKFSPEQKEIYEIVLSAQDSAFKQVKPGIMMGKSGEKAIEVIGKGLEKLGIIKDKNEAKKYCPHGISHFIGLAVHDVGPMGKLGPGMVITIEPGIYIPDSSNCSKKYWGIGIRIEDDVLVTENGCEVLSKAAPKNVAEIEKLMKQNGIGNVEKMESRR